MTIYSRNILHFCVHLGFDYYNCTVLITHFKHILHVQYCISLKIQYTGTYNFQEYYDEHVLGISIVFVLRSFDIVSA